MNNLTYIIIGFFTIIGVAITVIGIFHYVELNKQTKINDKEKERRHLIIDIADEVEARLSIESRPKMETTQIEFSEDEVYEILEGYYGGIERDKFILDMWSMEEIKTAITNA